MATIREAADTIHGLMRDKPLRRRKPMRKGKGRKGSVGRKRINRKTEFLVKSEGLEPKHAYAKAMGMARQGSLGRAAKSSAGARPKK